MAAPIPQNVKQQLLNDSFMRNCCICGRHPQWHHNLIFAAKAVNEAWCILPLCPEHHDMARNKRFKQLLDWAMLNRASDDELDSVSKVIDYKYRKLFLNEVYGQFSLTKMRQLYEDDSY